MDNPSYYELTRATPTIESSHPAVTAFARNVAASAATDVERAVALYYAVRDKIRYDLYAIDLTVEGMKASTTLRAGRGWCVSKAVLLAACCRSFGIPARLGFADVRNHLSTERMRQQMRTDLFCWHGYAEMLLDGKWVKATPAFNIELCEKFRLLPIEFNGREDSLYHPYDAAGQRHMEYVASRGAYSDLPLEQIIQTFKEEYGFEDGRSELRKASFDEDVELESRL